MVAMVPVFLWESLVDADQCRGLHVLRNLPNRATATRCKFRSRPMRTPRPGIDSARSICKSACTAGRTVTVD